MLNDASFSSTLTLLRLSRTDVTDVFIYALAGASARDTRRVARARELEASTSRRGGAVARAVRTDVVAGAMASSSPRTPRAVLPSTTSGGCGVACASSSSSSSSSGQLYPCILDLHGGIWNYNDRTLDAVCNTALAEAGFVLAASLM